MADNNEIAKKKIIYTYFYVFADVSAANNNVEIGSSTEINKIERTEAGNSLDSIVSAAFKRFSRVYEHEADVELTMKPDVFHRIRKVLGIQQLPAFGIANVDLTSKDYLSEKPQHLPSVWNLLKYEERRAVLQSGTFLPKVERAVVSLYSSSDDLYNFVRDLHFINMDDGLSGVAKKIDAEVRRLGGKKLLNVITVGKKVFMG